MLETLQGQVQPNALFRQS